MQILKDDVRDQILTGALSEFKIRGYKNATVADIASAAGVSTGNVYRYFKSKKELFEELFPKSYSEDLLRQIRVVTSATFGKSDLSRNSQNLNYWKRMDVLLANSIKDKERLIVILNSADGTPLEGFREEVLRLFVLQALRYARSTIKGFRLSSQIRFILEQVYSSFISNICHILQEKRSDKELISLLEHLRVYHLAGLTQLLKESDEP